MLSRGKIVKGSRVGPAPVGGLQSPGLVGILLTRYGYEYFLLKYIYRELLAP